MQARPCYRVMPSPQGCTQARTQIWGWEMPLLDDSSVIEQCYNCNQFFVLTEVIRRLQDC